MSIKRFKVKARFFHAKDKVKNFFQEIGNFLYRLKIHPKTEKVSYHIKKASNKFSTNISNNNQNWKHRIASGPSFEISEKDG